MGILTNLVDKSRSYSLDDFEKEVISKLNRGSHSGVRVDEHTAMRYVTVFSCVRVLAETMGSLPLFVYKSRSDGGKDKATDHPVYWLLHDQPNDEMTSLTWRETQVGHQVISGNNYSVITPNNKGQPIDIYPVPWNDCQPYRDPMTGKIRYRVNDRGNFEDFPAERILHIPGLGFDGVMGYSPIRMAQEAVGLGMAASEFSARFYAQGMTTGGVLEHPAALGDKAYERLQKWINETGVGMGNSWKPMILEEGMKFSRIPMPMTDAQFIETRKFSREEICGLFRVPPHMIADLSMSTNNNIEQQSLEFIMYSSMPYIKRWEQGINWKLFTKEERQQGYYAKFNVNAFLRGDFTSRQNALHLMRQDGVINADEWREMEDLNPQEGDQGKTYLVNGNMVPARVANEGATVKKGGDNSA
ncbi:phage portal protein [Pullulanibacillus sp. KACC 23026]|uniref:phage portal protein n=1 Tax=Pullulanibacillus sp. KACC 23026 TaxID=3028315 RepID=UPI0023AFAE76|nr:phage portal protein [Pullulanibacillus sp. KACC 23026]WEG14147.1 phage portal protein [Pullulanibacillus sp. KACC 23026]